MMDGVGQFAKEQNQVHAVIIGAGVIGLACAYALARAGASVRIIEQHLPGAGQSTRTGGGIRLSHGAPINVVLTRMSLPFWKGFEARFGIDPQYRQTGHLFLTNSAGRVEALCDQAKWHEEVEVPSELLSNEEIRRRWPQLKMLEFVTGSHCAVGGYLNQHSVVQGLAQGAMAARCTLLTGTRVEGLLMEAGRVEGVMTSRGEARAGLVVNAAGPAAGRIAAFAGLSIPFVSRRHELLVVRPQRPVPDDTPWLIDLDTEVHLRPDGQGRALIGGFLGADEAADPEHYAREYSPDWADRVRVAAADSFGLSAPDCEIVEGWAGLYPGTLDYLPVVEVSMPGLITAAGFSGTGLMHAPAVGQLVAGLATGDEPPGLDLSALSSARFKEGPGVAEQTGF